MATIPNKRKWERMLLTAVLFTAFCGFALVFLGKLATTPLPPVTYDINQLDAGDFARVLSVSKATGQKLTVLRESQPGRRFGAVYTLRHAKILQAVVTSPIDSRFIVRTRSAVARRFWGGVLVFLAAFLIIHLILQHAAANSDPFLLPLVAFLSSIGLMMVYSVKDPYRDTFVFESQLWGLLCYGLLALLIPLIPAFGRLVLRRYQYAYAAVAVALMALLLFFGHGPGHVHIRLFGFEPVEIIKVLLVFFVASYITERRGALGDPHSSMPRIKDFGPMAVIYAFTLFLFIVVKDLGPAVLLFGAFLALLYLATQRIAYPAVGIALLLIAGVAGYYMHLGFFATRVVMWLNPWSNHDKNGSQLAQGLWGMATGGVTGSGLGMGSPSLMPRSGSDLIFASIGEELGLVGTLAVLLAYVLLIARGLRIALRAVTDFDRLLAAGLTILLGLQTMIITGGVTGLLPLTGMTLPFISFGASSLVADFFAIGVLLHLSHKTLPSTVADQATPEWTRAARHIGLGFCAYLLFGIGIARLFVVQGIQDAAIAARPLISPQADGVARAQINPRLLALAAAIPRGAIRDRNGVILAQDAKDPEDARATAFLCPDGNRQRLYPGGPACAHLLRAVEASKTPDNPLGRNAELRGFAGYADLLPCYRRRYLPFASLPRGQDITLTIDLSLQQTAFQALKETAGRLRDRRTGRAKDRGAAVLLDAATGEVLAAATLPTFDPATLTQKRWEALNSGRDGQSTLINRAVLGIYPPGSVFKIITAAAALEHGQGDLHVFCPHAVTNIHWTIHGKRYARRRITDEEGFTPHGDTDLAKALRVSCNVYFATMGIRLGADVLNDTARSRFGLEHMPTLAKLGEDLPDCAYGQGGVLVTPLEMARAAQAVANRGQMLPAQFIKRTAGASLLPTAVLSASHALQLQSMLTAVTTDGTAHGVFDGLPVSVAGKTGSAQNNQGDGMTHSWFAGFAPAVNPTLAFACVIENGGSGRGAAAPVCRDILAKAFR